MSGIHFPLDDPTRPATGQGCLFRFQEMSMHMPGTPALVIQSMLDRLSGKGERILLILDTKGIVQYCNSPEWFSGVEGGVEGAPIATVVPRLPLRSKTPGYNVAYARFTWGDRWQRQMVNVGAGTMVAMEAMVKAVPIGHGYCLVVALRSPKETEVGYISVLSARGKEGVPAGTCSSGLGGNRLPEHHARECRA